MLKFYIPDNIERASKRLRAEIPSQIFGKVIDKIVDTSDDDVVVLSKKTTVRDIKYLLDRKIKFIFDICDDQFEDPTYSNMFKYACENANLIVVPTQSMKRLVESKINRKVFVIGDPFERNRNPPCFNIDQKIKLLFFGCRDNFIPINWNKIINKLEGCGIDFQIDAIFNNIELDYKNFKNEKLNIHTWSFDKQTFLMENCDLIILPFMNNHKNISVKSANRIIESLQMGKFVISNFGVDSYKEFGDFIFLDNYDKICEGIIWACANKNDVLDKIKRGQEYINSYYSPTHISNLWKKSYQLVKEENLMKNKLVEIIEKYNMNGFVGKYDSQGRHLGGWGTDKNDFHSYCDYYEKELTPYQEKEINILEIGSNYGCSAIMWHDFLPKSKLLLLDIQETINPKAWEIMDESRFTYANCDAYLEENAEEALNLFPDGFDIIFEDGPHTLDSQLKFLELYLPMLNDGGIVFIEDIQDVDHFELLKDKLIDITEEDDEFNYDTQFVDLRHIKDRYDDLIFVVKKTSV
jgi:hypothetical protein